MIADTDFAAAARRSWFHLAYNATPESVESILENGLERGQSNYCDFWESRAGHVYFSCRSHLEYVFWECRGESRDKAWKDKMGDTDWALFEVSVADLAPARIVADEDHFTLHGGSYKGGMDVLQRLRLEIPPHHTFWDWAKHLKIGMPPSLGEWAEAIGLGDDPATTAHSLHSGSLAYRGVLPPSALRLVRTTLELDPERLAA